MSLTGTQSVAKSDNGSIIGVVTWFLVAFVVLAFVARISTKLTVSQKVNFDDYVAFLGLLFSVGQSVSTSVQARNGLGQHLSALTSSQLRRFQQSLYAADLLYIANLCFVKISILLLLRNITPIPLQRRLILATGAVIVLWSISAEFAIAFRCHSPQRWKFIDNTCFSQTAFWNYFGILNIITEAVLVLLPLVIVWRIQIALRRKAKIFICFAVRMVVVASIIVQLIYLNRASSTSDPTYDFWPLVLCTQIVQNVSFATACVPYLKPFLENLESGLYGSDDLSRHGKTGTSEYGSPNSTRLTHLSLPRATSKASKNMLDSHRLGNTPRGDEIVLAQNGATTTTATVGSPNRHEWDVESQTSQSRIIKQTTSWTVLTQSR